MASSTSAWLVIVISTQRRKSIFTKPLWAIMTLQLLERIQWRQRLFRRRRYRSRKCCHVMLTIAANPSVLSAAWLITRSHLINKVSLTVQSRVASRSSSWSLCWRIIRRLTVKRESTVVINAPSHSRPRATWPPTMLFTMRTPSFSVRSVASSSNIGPV